MATDPLSISSQSEITPEPSPGRVRVADRDLELVRRVTLREEAAIRKLYDCYSVLVYSVARHVLADDGLAEDVLQEIFLQLWRNPDSFDPARGSLSTWLTVLARHRAIDRYRRRHSELDVAEMVIPTNGNQLAHVTRLESALQLRKLLKQMPVALREALELAYFEGLTQSEISVRLGAPLGTIKSRIRLGLEWLRLRLSERAVDIESSQQ